MRTKTVRIDPDTLEKAEIQAIKESARLMKRVNLKDVLKAAVEEYIARDAEKNGQQGGGIS